MAIDYVVHTLDPWLVRIEKAIVKDLLLEEEKDQYFPKFNVDGLLRGDFQSRMQGHSTGISNGILSPNEARLKENMPPIDKSEGGDFHIVNGTFIKLKDIGAQYNVEPEKDGEKTEENTKGQDEEKSEDQHPDEEVGAGSEEPKESKRHAERRRKRKAERRGTNPGKGNE